MVLKLTAGWTLLQQMLQVSILDIGESFLSPHQQVPRSNFLSEKYLVSVHRNNPSGRNRVRRHKNKSTHRAKNR